MHDELLEDIAQNNGLREVNTWVKLAAGLGCILLCLLSGSWVAPLFIGVVLSGTVLILARIKPRIYFEIFIAPFTFAFTSVVVIVLVTGGSGVFWSWDPFPWLSLSVTRESINEAVFVFSRVIGGMSAMIFIALTTPMTDLFVVMRQCRVPEPVVDLAMFIYRSIFLILDQLVLTYRAQVMRLGYGSFRESVRSFATLCGSVFITSWGAGEDLIRAMDARCYEGKFAIMGESNRPKALPVLALCSFFITTVLLLILTKDFTVI
ncbi:MAG: cobalt ECF transporter T component CbiQ [Methanoregulaceae archaeon]|nr:cobalt ECF transporter T component CbiQ [Methanoregulaceae archaeon]